MSTPGERASERETREVRPIAATPARTQMFRRARVRSRRAVERLQRRASAALGIDAAHRAGTVVTMLENNQRRAPGYWIQLLLAVGIATLGLVLGSTAVVIGAMLVSPLMGPIVELGMGLAVGSSSLVVRAMFRTLLSVILAIALAALLTRALPFHTVTAEIAARTAPTVLDLLIAIFCALTAAYTTVRPGADTTAAAAGTAIGIALVPPLCTTGFGLGTGALDVARGAALLFTANVSAIVVFAVVSFLVLGFNQVNAEQLEEAYAASDVYRVDRLSTRVVLLVRSAFASRYGLGVRVVLPLLLLAAVFLPLRQALVEVTWEIHAREAVRDIVKSDADGTVQSAIDVEHHGISVRLVLVDSARGVGALQRRIASHIAERTGVVPDVHIVAVPNARMLAADVQGAAGPARTGVSDGTLVVPETRSYVASRLDALWPSAAGPLIGWELRLLQDTGATVTVRHLGPPLGALATSILERDLLQGTATPTRIVDVALPPNALTDSAGGVRAWADSAVALIGTVHGTPGVLACVTMPAERTARARRAAEAVRARLLAADSAAGDGGSSRVRITPVRGARWSIAVTVHGCAPPPGGRAATR